MTNGHGGGLTDRRGGRRIRANCYKGLAVRDGTCDRRSNRARNGFMLSLFRRLVFGPPPALSPIMAWRCSGSTNTELVDNMARKGLINSPRVKDVRRIYRPADPLISAL